MENQTPETPAPVLDKKEIAAIAGITVYIIALLVVCAALFCAHWKGMTEGPKECHMMYLAIAAGLLGSLLFMAGSLGARAGTKKFEVQWLVWYILRPFTGVGIAFMGYLAIKADFIAGSLNPHGVLLLCVLFGMFSSKALEYFERVFDGILGKDNQPRINDADAAKKDLAKQEDAAKKALAKIIEGLVDKTIVTKSEVVDGKDANKGKKVISITVKDEAAQATLKAMLKNPYEFEGYKIPLEIKV